MQFRLRETMFFYQRHGLRNVFCCWDGADRWRALVILDVPNSRCALDPFSACIVEPLLWVSWTALIRAKLKILGAVRIGLSKPRDHAVHSMMLCLPSNVSATKQYASTGLQNVASSFGMPALSKLGRSWYHIAKNNVFISACSSCELNSVPTLSA